MSEKTVKEIFETLTDDQKEMVYYLVGCKKNRQNKTNPLMLRYSPEMYVKLTSGLLVKDLFNTLTNEQQLLVYYLTGTNPNLRSCDRSVELPF